MNVSALKIWLFFCFFGMTACNIVDVDNSNTVFDKFSHDASEYKSELATILKSRPEGLHYTFNKFVEKDGKEYLDIQIKGDSFTATGLVLVKNWNKLKSIKRTKGKGYSGAELMGLKLDIEENSSGATLVYNDLERIAD